MPKLTVCAGIFLPNGEFIPNAGDGHAKNARRICDSYPELAELLNNSSENEDDFIIQCGCAIVAGYDGNRCFKIAENNPFPEILTLKQMYEDAGISIWAYWQFHDEYLPVITRFLEKNKSERFQEKNSREWRTTTMDLNGKRGFIINGEWYPNTGLGGHDGNAFSLIENKGWKKEWLATGDNPHDFLVIHKGAIQLGSGGTAKKIVLSSKFHSELKLRALKRMYNLEDYDDPIWY
ncbi:MAG: hypothetical protein IKF38_07190 [Clostridia bacterium]|nr:hypothetical protein [Clostridia bacterium]